MIYSIIQVVSIVWIVYYIQIFVANRIATLVFLFHFWDKPGYRNCSLRALVYEHGYSNGFADFAFIAAIITLIFNWQ